MIWPTFKDATRHVLRNEGWRHRQEPAVRRALAGCLVEKADSVAMPEEKAALLIAARRWDRHLPALLDRARPLAEELDTLELYSATRGGDAAAAKKRYEDRAREAVRASA